VTFKTFKLALLSATIITSMTHMAEAKTLGESVSTSLNSHPEVLIAKQNKAAILQEWEQAKSGYLPTVDLNIGSGHERSNNSTTRNRTARDPSDTGGHRSLWRNEASLTANQMIFDGFETSANICQQRARFESAAKNTQEVQDTIVLRTVQAYLDVLRNKELVQLSQENLTAHTKYLKQITARSDSGRGNKADIRQAEGRLALAEANLYSAQGELKNANASYKEIVGESPKDLVSYKTPTADIPTTIEESLKRALEVNPAIHSAKYDIKAADSALDGTKASFYPRLDLELDAQRQQNLDGQPGGNNSYSAMARIRYNLYRGGADIARKREQTARVQEAHDTLERDRREIEERMYEAWNDLQTAKTRLKPLNNHVVSSGQTKTAYKSQFDIGQRSLLDLLDSEIEYFNSKTAHINGQYAVDFAVYNVLATTGDIQSSFKK
jgi:adhesin transport system outer membrane protein